jgi:hypothetical protein
VGIERSSLKVTDHDSSGALPEVIECAIGDVSTIDISILEGDDNSYLLAIEYENPEDIEDLVCAICMLCMSNGVYNFSIHYMGREGGVVR